MAAATAGAAIPIRLVFTEAVGGAAAAIRRFAEKATQTFQIGTPVQIEAASGYLQACATINSAATALIAGISAEQGASLTSNGVAKTQNLTNKVQNQSAAVITPLGAPMNDGTSGLFVANNESVFEGILGDSTDDTLAVVAATDLGAIFGLTKDATTLCWYIDKAITTVNGGACVVIEELVDAVGTLHGKVRFKVLRAAQQLNL